MALSVSAQAGLTPEQMLGSALYQDTNLSLNKNQSCASCHSLGTVKTFNGKTVAAGFVDPENVATGSATSRGSVAGKFGGLNSPSAGYAAFSPSFHFDETEGLWVGGQFWNGRSATLEDQAKGPFLNPLEMAMPSRWAVISEIKNNKRYMNAFQKVYGFDLKDVPSNPLAASDDSAPQAVFDAYDLVASAIANFERSRKFNAFDSKFDFVTAGATTFSDQEARGMALFAGKAQCSLCHVMDPATGPDGNVYPAVFTDFTYDNIGVPRNHSIAGNPGPDNGLAATTGDAGDAGKHKVMSLRNIAVTAPYAHNSYFATLEEIVHFYNTRDVASEGWANAEVPVNVNNGELGNLGLTDAEEADVVAFLKTLTDNYPAWGMDPNVPEGTPSPW
ncbi:MAG: methylamine utilization protein MauG [endosymbiont of Galathealinum brachiosum]|uniref:Methylamine utilization protein MauG n=1 Tax=endosymbiont of Galathealinum brachiosum TaxID=2200906 RepID=A0A370DE33_9GAMM|nr:MAG: methylamine utilization protein MauG [endosymbiont of Galathealinum brachiosum]